MTNTSETVRAFTKAEIDALVAMSPDKVLHEATVAFMSQECPIGTYDNASRFYLRDKYSCCASIRAPSRDYPWSQLQHGRTATHLAHAYGIEDRAQEIQRYARLMKKHPELALSEDHWRVVSAAHQAGRALRDIEKSSRVTKKSARALDPAVNT